MLSPTVAFPTNHVHTCLLQSLVAPTPDGTTDLVAFLASLAPQLTAVLVFGQKGQELADLAAALQTTVGALGKWCTEVTLKCGE